MSFLIELKVPDIGNVSDVEVAEVLIEPGDVIELDQTIISMESDKASMEIPSSAAGTVEEVKVNVGDSITEGSLIATVSASTEEIAAPPEEKQPPAPEAQPQAEAAEQKPPAEEPAQKQPPAVQRQPAPAIPASGKVSGKAHA